MCSVEALPWPIPKRVQLISCPPSSSISVCTCMCACAHVCVVCVCVCVCVCGIMRHFHHGHSLHVQPVAGGNNPHVLEGRLA